MENPQSLYSPAYIAGLFNRMSGSYERVNTITSFGFSLRWRTRCAEKLQLKPGMKVADLMTGMGEAWDSLLPEIGEEGQIVALDLSEGMLKHAEKKKGKRQLSNITILNENILENDLEAESFDAVISTFGLKTFSEEQLNALAVQVKKILRPGGRFSFIEVSVPAPRLLRALYLFYLSNIIPVLGWIFLGNPSNYRMLSVYTKKFENCKKAELIFREAGFETGYFDSFYGCATGIYGTKK